MRFARSLREGVVGLAVLLCLVAVGTNVCEDKMSKIQAMAEEGVDSSYFQQESPLNKQPSEQRDKPR